MLLCIGTGDCFVSILWLWIFYCVSCACAYVYADSRCDCCVFVMNLCGWPNFSTFISKNYHNLIHHNHLSKLLSHLLEFLSLLQPIVPMQRYTVTIWISIQLILSREDNTLSVCIWFIGCYMNIPIASERIRSKIKFKYGAL